MVSLRVDVEGNGAGVRGELRMAAVLLGSRMLVVSAVRVVRAAREEEVRADA